MANIITLAPANNTFGFFKYKVSYTLNGIDVTEYCSDCNTIRNQCIKNPNRYSNFRSEEFQPTPEQIARLKDINSLTLDPIFKRNVLEDLSLYVESNVMVNKAVELSSLAAKAKEDTKVWLVNLLKPAVKALRNEVRYGGLQMFGTVIDTSLDAKVSTMGYVLYIMLQRDLHNAEHPDNPAPFPDETKQYNWKAKNDDFVLLTFRQICELSAALITHEEGCFAAEKLTLDYLLSLDVNELVKFRQLAIYDRVGNVVTQEVDTVTYNELKPIWDRCYEQAVEVLKTRKH